MVTMLIQNLQLLLILAGIFVLSFGANTLLGSIEALIRPDLTFDKGKLLMGVKKGGILFVGSLIVTVLISLLPTLLGFYGINSAYIENLSLVGMAAPILGTSINYIKDTIAKIFTILNINATSLVTPNNAEESVKDE